VGEGNAERLDCTAVVTELLPADRPRYLMGVGTPLDLLEAVHRGVDMFDCILPTALAKQGVAFTSMGRRDLRRAAYQTLDGPIDPECACATCATYSIAYLYHLNRVKEPQGWQLLGLHNVHFYLQLMARMRQHILAGTWNAFYAAQRELLDARDAYGPPVTHVTKAQRRVQKLALGRYEAVLRDGVGRIRDLKSGETMHSVLDPAEEAHLLYVEQSRLLERLAAPAPRRSDGSCRPLVVWDVGLGAAANAMAAIRAVEAAAASGLRPLHLVSFENDLDSLRLALKHPAWFKHLRHAAPRAMLEGGRWSREGVEWTLFHGDFATTRSAAPLPDLVFFDPFSYKTDTGLWGLPAFQALAQLFGSASVEIYTYSASTRVRAGLLAAGFFVARGRGTGPKAETTLALTPAAAAGDHGRELLGADWLARWQRSDAQAPLGVAIDDESWRAAILEHAQFRTAADGADVRAASGVEDAAAAVTRGAAVARE
jgi:queuine tRNA-ribosyltransferase